jgi:hypothetical protein
MLANHDPANMEKLKRGQERGVYAASTYEGTLLRNIRNFSRFGC